MIKLSKKEMDEMANRVWKRIAANFAHYKILEVTGYFENCKMN